MPPLGPPLAHPWPDSGLPAVFTRASVRPRYRLVAKMGPHRMPPMPDQQKQAPRQCANMTYMMEVTRRLEWDLHNPIVLTGRIPQEWHEIAKGTPRSAKVTVNLGPAADVVKLSEDRLFA